VRAEALLVLATLISLAGLALSGLAHSIDRLVGCRPARHAIVLLTTWGGGQYGCGSPGAGDPANS
jgi:hypothetical protein